MNNSAVYAFCAATVLATLGVCFLGARAVMVPESVAEGAGIPQPVSAFERPIDLGGDLGKVPVSRLMEYYVANPPQAESGGTGAPALPVQHFGGC